MPEVAPRGHADAAGAQATSGGRSDRALVAGWHPGLAIVNLRGDAGDAAFRAGVASVVGPALPVQPCTSAASDTHRVVWAGPDDWFVIAPRGEAEALETRLRAALADTHHAVTDVSCGYTMLHLSGAPARDVLAQGCPLDLHPRVFKPGMSAGSHYFKASIWLWQCDEAPTYEMLARRSFMGYVWLMLERSTQECGLVARDFA